MVILSEAFLEFDLHLPLFVDYVLLLSDEGLSSMHKLIEEDTEGPSVDLMSMWSLVSHLRRHVSRCSTVSISLFLVLIALRVSLYVEFTSPAKVTDLNTVIIVDQEVLRFEISVDELVLVQEVDADHGLDEVPEGLLFVVASVLADGIEKVVLRDVLHG